MRVNSATPSADARAFVAPGAGGVFLLVVGIEQPEAPVTTQAPTTRLLQQKTPLHLLKHQIYMVLKLGLEFRVRSAR